MSKRIIFFGKLPPPYIGPAVATEIILNSNLTKYFDLIHFDISHHNSISDLGDININNLLNPIKLYFKLVYYLFKYKPNIVYIPSQQTTIAYLRDIPFILISKLFRRKVVCHLRGGYFDKWYFKECGSIMKLIVRYIQKAIDGQIVLGHNLIKMYDHIMPGKNIFVVPNGGDYVFPRSENTAGDVIKILFLGNLIKSKGVIDFLNSCKLLPAKYYCSVQFIIAGNWMDCQEEINFILKNNPNLPVSITGAVHGHDKMNLLVKSDIFVFPTYFRNEGHPWVIVEALAAGLPIISTDHGAIKESVTNGENGFIIEKNNPKQIAEKIQYFLDNQEILIEMGKNSRKHYLTNFTEERLVENFTNVFNSIIKSK